MKLFNVYLDGVEIDKVSFTHDCTEDYVKFMLVHREGYDSSIVVISEDEKYFDGSIDEE